MFACLSIYEAIINMTKYATTAESVMWIAASIVSVNSGSGGASVPLFATVEMSDALASMAQFASTDDAAQHLAIAIGYLCETGAPEAKQHFRTPEIRDALVKLCGVATSPTTAMRVGCALYQILLNSQREWLRTTYMTTEVHDALLKLSAAALDEVSADYVTIAVLLLAKVLCDDHQSTESCADSPFATAEMRDTLLLLAHRVPLHSLADIAQAVFYLANHRHDALPIFATTQVHEVLQQMAAITAGTEKAHVVALALQLLFPSPVRDPQSLSTSYRKPSVRKDSAKKRK